MRKTERNFTNKVLESKRGDVQAVKSKIKSSVMAVAFLFAATMPLTMAVSSRNVQAAVTQQKQIQTVNQKVKTNTSKAIKTITPKKVTSATMIKAYKKYLRKNVSNKKYYAIVNIGDNNARFKYKGSSIEAVKDRLPTAEIEKYEDGVYTVRAEVFGKGIERWIRGQGDAVEVL